MSNSAFTKSTLPIPISKLNGGTGNTNGTADALTTARTIFGQSFDGTANIGGDLQLGSAGTTDTTLSRVSAGVIAVEGVNILTETSTNIVTNKTFNSNTNYIDADATHQKVFLALGRAGVVGDVVYVSAWNVANNCAAVSLARSNSQTTLPAAGVLESAGADGTVQSMRVEGILNNVDTSTWSTGTPVSYTHLPSPRDA